MGTEKVSKPTPPRKSQLALDFKSATLYAIRVVLHEADTSALIEALAQRMNDAGAFFENEPVVVDAGRIEGEIDWPALVAALRSHHLHPVGVVAEGPQQQAALAAGLPAVDLGGAPVRPDSRPVPEHDVPAAAITPEKTPGPAGAKGGDTPAAAPTEAGAPAAPRADEPAAPADGKPATGTPPQVGAKADTGAEAGTSSPTAPPAVAPAAMVVNRPLRSGQRVYARDTDLIIIGVVSRGAEVIADGNVHVYGPLRGKAMAGARGDARARIFTTELDPELVAIAGVYRVIETKLDATVHNKPAIVSLSGESLQFESLGK